MFSPNQVLTHATRAAAEQLNLVELNLAVQLNLAEQLNLWWPRAARAKGSGLRPCYGPLFPARAKEKGDHNMGAALVRASPCCMLWSALTKSKSNHSPLPARAVTFA